MSDAAGQPSSAQVPVVLRVAPAEDEWGGKTDKWRSDAHELKQVLDVHLGEAVRPPTPNERHKGIDVLAVIVALGSSGALTAAVEAFRVWLGRKPDRRKLVVTYEVDGRENSLTVDAENVDSGDLAAVVASALEVRNSG